MCIFGIFATKVFFFFFERKIFTLQKTYNLKGADEMGKYNLV